MNPLKIGLRKFVHSLAALAILGAPVAQAQQRASSIVRAFTEEYPPFNYTANGKITGIATEVVEAVLKHIDVAAQIQSVPWARAYETTLNSENVLIFAIARSKEREKRFKWVGVVAPSAWYLFALKSRHLAVNSLEEAKKYQIGTVNQDAGEQLLLANQFEIGRNLQSGMRNEQNYEKLKLGRIDLLVMNTPGIYHIAREAGDNPNLLLERKVHLPELDNGVYMAFGPKTSEAMVDKFRKGLEAIKRNGVYDAIQKKWQ
jgi:polar amino acid transport system substrate-binding protein